MKKFQGTFRTLTAPFQANADGTLPTRIKVLPRGVFNTTKYGELQITDKIMDEMMASFRPSVRPVSIDRDHAPLGDTRAAGWVENLVKMEDGLHADVSWTPYGAELVGNREYRMLSPEWSYDYVDSEDRQELGATLLAVALTNRPLFKSVGTLTASEGLTNDVEVFILQGNSMTTKEILAKPLSERTPEEIQFLTDNRESMTEEEAKQYDTENTPVEDKPEDEPQTDPEPTVDPEPATDPAPTEPQTATADDKVTITASELASFKAMQEENRKLKEESLKASIEAKLDTFVCNDQKETRILGKSKSAIVPFLMSLTDGQRETFYNFCSELPAIKIVGEVGNGEAENSSLTAAEQIVNLTNKKAKELNISTTQADALIQKEHPALYKQYMEEVTQKRKATK